MRENIKTVGWLVATIVTVVVFIALCTFALPRLESSLTFVPILAVSVLAGAIAGFVARKRATNR
ncbi:MAG: hypothetical protein WBQ95_20565 [Terracidiphilus sp.]